MTCAGRAPACTCCCAAAALLLRFAWLALCWPEARCRNFGIGRGIAATGSTSLSASAGSSGGGGSGGAVHPRLEVNELMQHPSHTRQRDLFLWALRWQQDRPHTDPASFYQLMSIHGEPFQPYRGLVRPGFNCNTTQQWCGYCHHGDVLFPTWHRAYLVFVERHLQREAAAVAERFARALPGQAAAWRAAAAALRVPYWDFAGEAAARQGSPAFLVQERLSVLSPATGRPTAIANPLRHFVFPEDVGRPEQSFPLFTRRSTPTMRWPSLLPPLRSNTPALNASVLRHSAGRWRQGMRQVLAEPDWYCMSNHDAPLKARQRCAALSSLEFVHDLLHRELGGPRGHLMHTRIAAFDPLFLLLHVSTDRLLAMWQLAHPRTWVPPHPSSMGTRVLPRGRKLDQHTPLAPFYREGVPGGMPGGNGPLSWNASSFITSAEVRNWRQLGYDYAGLEGWAGAGGPAGALREMLAAYPMPAPNMPNG